MSKKKTIWLVLTLAIIGILLYFFAKTILPQLKNLKPSNHYINLYTIIAAVLAVVGFIFKTFWDYIKYAINIVFAKGKTKGELASMITNEKQYLENLIERFKQEEPWEIDKFTDLQALNESVNIQARKGKPKKIKDSLTVPDSLEEELRSTVSIKNYLEKELHKGKPIMIKGEPGSGKTIMVRKYAADIAKKSLNQLKHFLLNPPLPLFVSLNAYNTVISENNPEPFYEFIKKYLQSEYAFSGYILENFEKLLLAGRFIIILDGLNEMPPHDFKLRLKNIEKFFIKDYPKNKCIITCRSIQPTSLYDYRTLEINELNDYQIRQFIKAYKGEDAIDYIFDEIKESTGIPLKRFRNPFILRIFLLRAPQRTAPNSLGQLYSEYVKDKLDEFQEYSQTLIERLSKIAFCMSDDGLFAGNIDIDVLEKKLNIIISKDFLDKCAKANLIDRTIQGKFRFYHQIFQEYFAALELDALFKSEGNYKSFLSNPNWEETVLVWGGIVTDLPTLIKDVRSEDTNIRSFYLALKLCATNPGKIDITTLQQFIDEAEKIFEQASIIPKVETLKALSSLETENSIHLIGAVLIDSNGWVREICIQILGKSENDFAKIELTQCIKELDSSNAIIQARYFLPFNTWLFLYIRNRITFGNLLTFLMTAWQYSFIFLPFLFFTFLYRGSYRANLDPITFIGRIVSIFYVLLLINKTLLIVKFFIRQKIDFNLKLFFSLYTIFDLVILALVPITWIYPGEILSIFGLLFLLLLYSYSVYVTIYILRNVLRLADFINSLMTKGRLFSYMILVVLAAKLMGSIFPHMRETPIMNIKKISSKTNQTTLNQKDSAAEVNSVLYKEPSTFEKTINNWRSIVNFYITPLWFDLAMAIGYFSIATFLFTYFYYAKILIKVKRWEKHQQYKDIDDIMALIQSRYLWPKVKTFTLSRLRKSNITEKYIDRLESYNDKNYEVMNELERTVYEMRSQH